MSTRDPITTLAARRPLESDWSQEARESSLARVLDGIADGHAPRRMHRPRRRAVLVGAAAAAALALGIGAPLLSNTAAPSAAAVEQLVTNAARSSALVIPEGTYLHMVVEDVQHAPGQNDPADGVPRVLESWTSPDGSIWRRDVQGSDVAFFAFPPSSGGEIDASPAGVASLPSDPAALGPHLRERVSGSNSENEAVFVAVGDLTRQGYVPPKVRAALIEVAAGLPEVTASREGGRTTLTFDDQATRPGSQSLVFDSATGSLLAERTDAPELTFTSTTTVSELVDQVPQEVLAGAAEQAKNPPKG